MGLGGLVASCFSSRGLGEGLRSVLEGYLGVLGLKIGPKGLSWSIYTSLECVLGSLERICSPSQEVHGAPRRFWEQC